MSKYSPLGDYLRARSNAEIPMTFSDIERVIAAPLPPAAGRHAAWWSNNPSNNVMTKVWLDAGYRSERVDLSARKLVFRRSRRLPPSTQAESTPDPNASGPDIIERLGRITDGGMKFAPDFDPTAPTGEIWEAQVS